MSAKTDYVSRRFSLLSIVAGVAAALSVCGLSWFIGFKREAEVPLHMAEVLAGLSPSVKSAIGKPITRGSFIVGRIVSSGGNGTADLSTSISGPLGSGKLLEWAQEKEGHWQVCSLVFHPNGDSQPIPVVSDEMSRCERE